MVHARDGADLGRMATVLLFKRKADFSDRRMGPRGLDAEVEQVALAGARRPSSGGRGLRRRRPRRARPCSRSSLASCAFRTSLLSIFSTLTSVSFSGLYELTPTTVWMPESIRAWVRAADLFDPQLRDAGVDRLGHAAGLVDLLHVGERLERELAGQVLDVVAAGPRVDHAGSCPIPAGGRAGSCGRCGR